MIISYTVDFDICIPIDKSLTNLLFHKTKEDELDP